MFNLPKPNETVADKKQDDILSFMNLISEDAKTRDLNIGDCYRIGRKIDGQHRPLLVRFKGSYHVDGILRKYRPVNRIFTNRDLLTVRQRNTSHLVRKEFKGRKKKTAKIILN